MHNMHMDMHSYSISTTIVVCILASMHNMWNRR